MKVLFLTITPFKSQKMTRDIANEFVKAGHSVNIVCPEDEQHPSCNQFVSIGTIDFLFVKSGNTTGKIGLFKKVKNLLLIDAKYKRSIKKAINNVAFDLILYSTPPITLVGTIKWAKKKYKAATYLMLKDIFPQNAVDMGMIKTHGVSNFIYRYFRSKEKKLYKISDFIGCMSEANRKYILQHNSELSDKKVGICVNSYAEATVILVDEQAVRERYNIPENKIVFLYGGNLGKPQGLDFLVKILHENQTKSDRFFLICGNGNEQNKIIDYIKKEEPSNVLYMASIPANDFDVLSRACDVGMIFLDHRFTIPNFPSRLLSIMINEKPILAATDPVTDLGAVIADGDMGWWCESNDASKFNEYIDNICNNICDAQTKGKNARKYYETHYSSSIAYQQIIRGLDMIGEVNHNE